MFTKADLFVPAVMRGLEETLRLAAERGLNVEFQGMYAPERLSGPAYAENIEIARAAFLRFPGRVLVHAPFYDVNPVSRDAEMREISRRRCGQVGKRNAHFSDQIGPHPVEKGGARAELVAVADRAADDAAQHVDATFISRGHAIGAE